jgi:hypothetical protein
MVVMSSLFPSFGVPALAQAYGLSLSGWLDRAELAVSRPRASRDFAGQSEPSSQTAH